ncbi:hypothetical protein [Janthinobacterium svalbardensis]|uniref:hypothetical protein n=1 Tax=Janthinobacterium svalbardensis TaxID=368607 RepID=UPI002FCD6C01
MHELDELLGLDDDEYDRLDLFQEADELIGQLRTADVPALLTLWQQRDLSWQQRFTQASTNIDGAVLRALLAGLLQIRETPHGVFELMSRLPATADGLCAQRCAARLRRARVACAGAGKPPANPDQLLELRTVGPAAAAAGVVCLERRGPVATTARRDARS